MVTGDRAAGPTQLRRLVAAGADLVLARGCAGCGASRALWCDRCAPTLAGAPFEAWPTPAPAGLPRPYAAARYDGPVRAALLAHKEDGRLALAAPLGAALARAVRRGLADSDAVAEPGECPRPAVVRLVPAPSRPAAVRARGHDATLRLARAAAAALRRSGQDARVLPVLHVRRGVADQAGLTAHGRSANVHGALRVPHGRVPLVGARTVIVVDDVITSGATAAEAARALRAAGAEVALTVTVAATARRHPPAA